MQIKKAIILSAGYGKRLNPMTLSKPKPLLEINKKTLLENTIYILEKFGIEEIMINVHYLSDQIDNVNAIRLLLSCATDQKVKLLETKSFIEIDRLPTSHKYYRKLFLIN